MTHHGSFENFLDYDKRYSAQLGAQVNRPEYASSDFGEWGATEYAVFYPSPLDTRGKVSLCLPLCLSLCLSLSLSPLSLSLSLSYSTVDRRALARQGRHISWITCLRTSMELRRQDMTTSRNDY